jgi:hypothetical protein
VNLPDQQPHPRPAASRGETLRLKVPSPAKVAAPQPASAPVPVANGHPRPVPTPQPKVEKTKGPGWMPKEWEPGRTVEELRAQLDDLLLEVPEMLRGPVRPLALGARQFFAATARPGRKQRCSRWLRAWVHTAAYQAALAADGAQRHDRRGVPVEPVAAEHQEEARRRLEWLARRRGGAR